MDIGAVAKRWKIIVVFAVVFAVLFYSYASFLQRPSYKNSKVYVIVNNVYAADQSASMSDISVSRSLAETYCGMIRMSEMMQQLADYLLSEKGMNIREAIAQKNIVVRWVIYIAFIMFILIYGSTATTSDFIYANF